MPAVVMFFFHPLQQLQTIQLVALDGMGGRMLVSTCPAGSTRLGGGVPPLGRYQAGGHLAIVRRVGSLMLVIGF